MSHQSIKGAPDLNYGQSDSDEELTAYHEAGHAVIAYALGGNVESVQLGGEADDWLPERFGDCRIHWERLPGSPAAADWQRGRELLTILAGPVAEMIYSGEPYHPACFGPWKDDWQRAWVIAKPTVADERRRTRYLEETTLDLYGRMKSDHVWPAVAAVADELLAHELLDRDQIADTLAFWIGAH